MNRLFESFIAGVRLTRPFDGGSRCTFAFFSSDRRALPSGLLDNPLCRLSSSQIESMMLKLQRLQQKAILDDDYDAGELQTFRLLRVAL